MAKWSNTSKCNEAEMEAQSSTAVTGRDPGVTFIHDTNTVRIQTLAAVSTGRGQNPS